MLFQEEHIGQIREGEKTATRRDWAENYNRPSEGSIRMASTKMFQKDANCDCYIRVTDVYQEPLGEMTEEDATKEGGYSLEEFREVWKEINGEWDPELVVDVVEFEYVGLTRPEHQEKLRADGGTPAEEEHHDDGGLVTREQIEEYEEEHDEMHPAFEVDHRPERVPVNDPGCLWDGCDEDETEETVTVNVYGTAGEPDKSRVCEEHLSELRSRNGVSVEVLDS